MMKSRPKPTGWIRNLKKLQAKRNTIINHAELPVEGLSFTEDGLTLNGIPFADGHVSDSQKMELPCS